MRGKRNPVRLVVALSIAAALAVFLLYTSFAGGATPSLRPGQLHGQRGKLNLVGTVAKPITGDARGAGLRFSLRDAKTGTTVPVVFKGSKPDLFRLGRSVFLTGQLQNGIFAATSLVTKCPSKYTPKPAGS